MPKVSVIMPCFNHARFLQESVQGIIRQTSSDWELIIVDDCSTDYSWEIMSGLARKDSRITVIRHERNLGASRSRNDGMRAAMGEFLGFCDSDDVWEADKLAVQVRMLEENKECDVTYCDAIFIDEGGRPTGNRFSGEFPVPGTGGGQLFYELVSRNFINMQTVLMRRDCVTESGYFDEGIKWVEDWWYWLTVSRAHRFIYSKEPLAKYRVHGKSTGFTQKRGYPINRCKVYWRLLEQDASLPRLYRARIFYIMGVDLCSLGKRRAGRRFFWKAAALAITDPRAFNTLCKALARTVLRAKTIPVTAVPRAIQAAKC
jgi:glycosyltransferase involved in cell wall biosynthesis